MEALIVVDMLYDFINKNGAMYVSHSEEILYNINQLIDNFQNTGKLVIFTNDSHDKDDKEFKTYPPHCIAGTKGAEIVTILPRLYHIIPKKTFSGFSNDLLFRVLSSYHIEHLIICGVVTEICIKATALDAVRFGFKVAIVQDAIREINIPEANETLEIFRDNGIKLVKTLQVKEYNEFWNCRQI